MCRSIVPKYCSPAQPAAIRQCRPISAPVRVHQLVLRYRRHCEIIQFVNMNSRKPVPLRRSSYSLRCSLGSRRVPMFRTRSSQVLHRRTIHPLTTDGEQKRMSCMSWRHTPRKSTTVHVSHQELWKTPQLRVHEETRPMVSASATAATPYWPYSARSALR